LQPNRFSHSPSVFDSGRPPHNSRSPSSPRKTETSSSASPPYWTSPINANALSAGLYPRARSFNGNALIYSSRPIFFAIPNGKGSPAKEVIACFVVVILKLLRFFVVIYLHLVD